MEGISVDGVYSFSFKYKNDFEISVLMNWMLPTICIKAIYVKWFMLCIPPHVDNVPINNGFVQFYKPVTGVIWLIQTNLMNKIYRISLLASLALISILCVSYLPTTEEWINLLD